MSRMFGYMANEADRLRCALYPARAALATEAPARADSWGIAFYQGGEVLLQRRPRVATGQVDFYEVLRDLRTDTVVGHVRVASVGLPRTENTHPFRFRHWVFAHHGTLAAFEQIREELLESVPDFLRRNIRGQTDSEHLFHLFLAFLHDAGKLDDPNLSVTVAAQAMRASLLFAERLVAGARGGRSGLNIIATNGRIMLAARRGGPLQTMQIQGLADCGACHERLPDFGDSKPIPHEHLRSALIVSDSVNTAGQGWQQVAEGSLVTVDRELEMNVVPLRSES